MDDLISRQAAIETIQRAFDRETLLYSFVRKVAVDALKTMPSAQPEQKNGKKFIEIVAEYPAICPYPEYEGKPYFSIRYEENGEKIEGFGTYNPEVLSKYIREYFMGEKKGKWIIEEMNTYELSYGTTAYEPVYKCSVCERLTESYLRLDKPIMPEDADFPRFCPWCGAELEGTEDV